MTSPHPAAVLALLTDEARRRVLAAVVLGASTVPEIARVAGLEAKPVVRALGRLADLGVVADREDGGWSVRAEAFAEAAAAAGRMQASVAPEELGATAEQAKVLRGFLDGGRLTAVPAAHAKRLVVLDLLANRFEPGRVYPEVDVNRVLTRFHADVAALRRSLVEEGFLDRRDGFYWRAGGTYEVD